MKDHCELKKMMGGRCCTLYFVVKNGKSQCEVDMIKLKSKNSKKYKELLTFLNRIAENGVDIWKNNPEKYKYIESHNGVAIWEIKTHGLRVLDVENDEKNIILLELFKKKQNEYSKKNKENLKRSERLIDGLLEGRIL